MICFILGREFRLSIAEIHNFFEKAECTLATREFAFFDGISIDEVQKAFHLLGGSIKAVEIINRNPLKGGLQKDIIHLILKSPKGKGSKFPYAIASYGIKADIFTLGIQLKKEIKKAGEMNVRFVNKDSHNINAATFKKEKLATEGEEINVIGSEEGSFIGKTIAFQDVDAYSARDYGKIRDMQVGMLPPKLAQIMINLAGEGYDSIYDPFCGLGTILIESALHGKAALYGSDIEAQMVDSSLSNIRPYQDSLSSFECFKQDARQIGSLSFLKRRKDLAIITEGYLGSIMTRGHLNESRIQEERKILGDIYNGLFASLQRIGFRGPIILSFPFWQLKGKYHYFEEGYEIFRRYGFTAQKLLPRNIGFTETRSGSLLYHRPEQQVGREIFKLLQK